MQRIIDSKSTQSLRARSQNHRLPHPTLDDDDAVRFASLSAPRTPKGKLQVRFPPPWSVDEHTESFWIKNVGTGYYGGAGLGLVLVIVLVLVLLGRL
jgi:hypothetical protein